MAAAADTATSAGVFGITRKVVRGQLYKITPIQSDLRARVQKYIETSLQLDHEYIRLLYGRVNPVLQKDYDYFWESPWLQEHGQDTQKRRRVEEQQKSLAYSAYVKAACAQDTDDVKSYLDRVNQLKVWEEESHGKNTIKTVSRIVHSYELDSVRSMLSILMTKQLERPAAETHLIRLLGVRDLTSLSNGVAPVAHALRRNPILSDLFAAAVATQLILSVVCGGSTSCSIHMSRVRHTARDNALVQLLDAMESVRPAMLPVDTIGLPLMQVNCNMCISKGILVVTGGSDSASYILDISGAEEDEPGVVHDLTNVRTIQLSDTIIREEPEIDIDMPTMRAPKAAAQAPSKYQIKSLLSEE